MFGYANVWFAPLPNLTDNLASFVNATTTKKKLPIVLVVELMIGSSVASEIADGEAGLKEYDKGFLNHVTSRYSLHRVHSVLGFISEVYCSK